MPITPPAPIPGIPMPNIHDPITLQDITALLNHQRKVTIASDNPEHPVTKEQSAELVAFTTTACVAYGQTAFSAAQDFAPAWFAAAIEIALRPIVAKQDDLKNEIVANHDSLKNEIVAIKADIAGLKDDIAGLKDEVVAEIKGSLAVSQQWAANSFNLQCGDGAERPYRILPFNNGNSPADVEGLPALTDAQGVRQLSAAQATFYVNGYGLPRSLANVAAKRKAIGIFIGCSSTI